MKILLVIFLMLGIACKNDSGGGADLPGDTGGSGITVISGSPATTGTEETFYSFTPTIDLEGVTLSVPKKPSWADFNTTTGRFSGYPTHGTHDVSITGTRGGDSTSIAFTITVTGDPLAQHAWHLRNTGQSSFAKNGGTSGEDAGVSDVIRSGTKGDGVKIAISDTGLEIAHEDLASNVVSGSRNYLTNPSAPYTGDPTNSIDSTGDHGTSVAGIAAAVGWNNKGARGVAPSAKLVGFNYISSSQSLQFSLNQLEGNFDVFNQSWGLRLDKLFPYANPTYGTPQQTYDAKVAEGVQTLRSGKGAIYIRSAGNSAQETVVPGTNPPVYIGIPANNDPHNVAPHTIVVGAMNAKGERATYSSIGSCLWISGLAGEYGDDDPAMITTDQSGCSQGYSRSASTETAFMSGALGLNSECNYLHTFNGTSSAAPFVSGVVALMLEANPALGWRDVKHILAATATKVQPGIAAETRPFDPTGYVPDLAWITNAAGYHYHNYFGFGRVDAKAAVTMARTYTPTTTTFSEATVSSGTISVSAPDDSATGATNTLNLSSGLVVEAVQIKINLTHAYVSDVGIELTSPSGTRSILWSGNNLLNDTNFAETLMLSNAFYGENANGNWTIKFIDTYQGAVGTLTSWSLKVYGH